MYSGKRMVRNVRKCSGKSSNTLNKNTSPVVKTITIIPIIHSFFHNNNVIMIKKIPGEECMKNPPIISIKVYSSMLKTSNDISIKNTPINKRRTLHTFIKVFIIILSLPPLSKVLVSH